MVKGFFLVACADFGFGVRPAGFLLAEGVEAATETGDESLDTPDFSDLVDLTDFSSSLSSNRLIFGLITSFSACFFDLGLLLGPGFRLALVGDIAGEGSLDLSDFSASLIEFLYNFLTSASSIASTGQIFGFTISFSASFLSFSSSFKKQNKS